MVCKRCPRCLALAFIHTCIKLCFVDLLRRGSTAAVLVWRVALLTPCMHAHAAGRWEGDRRHRDKLGACARLPPPGPTKVHPQSSVQAVAHSLTARRARVHACPGAHAMRVTPIHTQWKLPCWKACASTVAAALRGARHVFNREPWAAVCLRSLRGPGVHERPRRLAAGLGRRMAWHFHMQRRRCTRPWHAGGASNRHTCGGHQPPSGGDVQQPPDVPVPL